MTNDGVVDRRPPTVVPVGAESPLLKSVTALWRKNSKWLGLMPEGAFVEAAERGNLLAALGDDHAMLGYILFRRARDAAWIAHLCVSPGARGKGVARSLVTDLRSRVAALRGIGLRCRNDFEAHELWRRLGFIPVAESLGRAGKPLTSWWLDFGHATLFTATQQRIASGCTVVAVDANVFFDLYDDGRPAAQESRVLLSDWLGELVIAVTDEIYTDISRRSDDDDRKRWRERADKHLPLTCAPDLMDALLPQAERVLFQPKTPQDRSDLRHLVRCAATGTRYFLTRDTRLLRAGPQIERELRVTVCRPTDFAFRIDQAERGDDYRPVDLSGTRLTVRPLAENDRDKLLDAFHSSRAGESRAEFLARLRAVTQVRGPAECRVVEDEAGVPIAVWGMLPVAGASIRVPLFRVRSHRADRTIARHLAHLILRRAWSSGARMVIVADSASADAVRGGLELEGFVRDGGEWAHMIIPPGESVERARAMLDDASFSDGVGAQAVALARDGLRGCAGDAAAMLGIERALWPARFPELELPCFIIAIRPHWAEHLFDEDLARGTLFGADPALMLNREAVYYRSSNSAGLVAPARVLWYVSGRGRVPGCMAIRASSYIDEISVGPAKQLFSRFRRLGVYEWHDVLEAAGGDPQADVMAIRFSGTEPLGRRLPWKEFQPILREHGVSTSLFSPTRIPGAAFERLARVAEGVR